MNSCSALSLSDTTFDDDRSMEIDSESSEDNHSSSVDSSDNDLDESEIEGEMQVDSENKTLENFGDLWYDELLYENSKQFWMY